jgi:rubrerythrin
MGQPEPDIEILELAICREADAYRLYMKMANRASDPQMKQILESLAKEELEHKARLELELMKLGVVVSSGIPTLTESLENDPDEPAVNMDFKDLLLLAIKKEQSSMRLYIELAAVTKDKTSRNMLISLAEEEAMHRARFEIEYNILMRKQPK